MRTSSPLRYPGGKSAFAPLLAEIRKLNGLGDRPVAEPYSGGAGASLTLLFREETPEIHINDLDPRVYDFWWAVLNLTEEFIEMLLGTPVTIEEWQRQRDIYRTPECASQLERGFATFFLNRCNRSGIIVNGGPIGGIEQDGRWKLDARFNKANLRRRCDGVAEFSDRLHVTCLDGVQFTRQLCSDANFFFIDPPYRSRGATLYLNSLDDRYHESLAEYLKSMSEAAWVLTYDDCAEVREMYGSWATVRPFSLSYTANRRQSGREVLIVPRWMQLPETQVSAAINW